MHVRSRAEMAGGPEREVVKVWSCSMEEWRRVKEEDGGRRFADIVPWPGRLIGIWKHDTRVDCSDRSDRNAVECMVMYFFSSSVGRTLPTE